MIRLSTRKSKINCLKVSSHCFRKERLWLSSRISISQSSQKVGPSMADDIKNAAFLAVVFAMFCMAAYILLRFRDISFSVGAFASVAVTTLCIISFYTLL